MKGRPCWCPKPILWELNSFLMQTLSFVSINLRRCRPREWKHSIQILQTAGLLYFFLKNELKEFDKRSKHFLLSDHFIYSHSVISWHCMNIVRRKWVAHWNTSFPSMDLLSIRVAGFYEVLLRFKPMPTKKFLKAKFLVLEMYFIQILKDSRCRNPSGLQSLSPSRSQPAVTCNRYEGPCLTRHEVSTRI